MAPKKRPKYDYDALVGTFVEAAREVCGTGPALSEALEDLGITSPYGNPISEATINNWIAGTSRPQPGTFLAIAAASGLSLDLLAGLYGKPEVAMAAGRKVELLRVALREMVAAVNQEEQRQQASGGS